MSEQAVETERTFEAMLKAQLRCAELHAQVAAVRKDAELAKGLVRSMYKAVDAGNYEGALDMAEESGLIAALKVPPL